MRIKYHYSLILCLLFFSQVALIAQYDESRTEKHAWATKGTKECQVENKYGNVEILAWDVDSIAVRVDISASGRKSDQVRKLFDRIDVETAHIGRIVSIKSTIRDKSKTSISRFFREDLNVDLDRSNVDINMTIFVPRRTNIEAKNKFGNIYIEDVSGDMNIVLEHGDFRLNNAVREVDLDVSFGDINMISAQYANISMRNGKVFANSIDELHLVSQGSEWHVDSTRIVEIESNKDEMYFDICRSITGEMKYGFLKIKSFYSKAELNLNYSKWYVDDLIQLPRFDIRSNSSDMYLEMSGNGYEIFARMEEGELRLPDVAYDIDKTVLDDKNEIREIKAKVGKEAKGSILIDARKSNITLFK